MYDLTGLFTTIASCSATIIAIGGGFIASKLISLGTERKEVIIKIKEINDEILFKEDIVKNNEIITNEHYALEYIEEHIKKLTKKRTFYEVYNNEDKHEIGKDLLKEYWEKAIQVFDKLLLKIDDDIELADVNNEDIPNELVKEINGDFEYNVCKQINRYIDERVAAEENYLNFAIQSIATVTPQYTIYESNRITKIKEEISNLKLSLEWLNKKKVNI